MATTTLQSLVNVSRMRDEEAILKKKLLYDGHGSGEDKRLVNLMKHISKLCLSEDPNDDVAKLINIISKDLTVAIYVSERNERISQMCDVTLDNLDEAIGAEGKHLEQLKGDLDNLVLELEYLRKLKEVNKLPNLETTEKTMQVVERRKQQLMFKMADQQKKFEFLVAGCSSLSNVLAWDGEVNRQDDDSDGLTIEEINSIINDKSPYHI